MYIYIYKKKVGSKKRGSGCIRILGAQFPDQTAKLAALVHDGLQELRQTLFGLRVVCIRAG